MLHHSQRCPLGRDVDSCVEEPLFLDSSQGLYCEAVSCVSTMPMFFCCPLVAISTYLSIMRCTEGS